MSRSSTLAGLVRALIYNVSHERPEREGLRETPRRFAEAWQFYTSGYEQQPEKVLKVFEDGAQGSGNEIVLVANIPLWSLCEHHLAPFWGLAHIGYLPKKRVLGLSKFVRLVEMYARRLQIQERLTNQVADALFDHLGPKGAGVVIECRHSCMEARGVRVRGAVTSTSALRGAFLKSAQLRNEFMQLVSNASTTKNGL